MVNNELQEQNEIVSVDEIDSVDEQEESFETMFMLSTIDNPFNPFDDFWNWRMFDIEQEYFCCEYLARIIDESDEMTEKEKIAETERAIDEIIECNPNPIYIKVSKKVDIYG